MQVHQADCPECGAPIEAGLSECPECGAVLAVETGVATGVATGGPTTDAGPLPTAPPVHQAALPIERKPVPDRELGVNTWYSSQAATRPTATRPPAGRAGLFSDVPVQLPRTRGGGLAVSGLLLTAVSLLLPWAPVANFPSYFDAWGLARPSTIVAFVLALVLLAIALEPVPLPMRTRIGWLPLLFGAAVVGLAWSRVDGGLAFIDIGGWLFAVGGALAVAGALAVLTGRGEVPPTG